VLKIDELMELYPEEIEKKLPCTLVNGNTNGELIYNDVLNANYLAKYPP
jgi:hypothetical protein